MSSSSGAAAAAAASSSAATPAPARLHPDAAALADALATLGAHNASSFVVVDGRTVTQGDLVPPARSNAGIPDSRGAPYEQDTPFFLDPFSRQDKDGDEEMSAALGDTGELETSAYATSKALLEGNEKSRMEEDEWQHNEADEEEEEEAFLAYSSMAVADRKQFVHLRQSHPDDKEETHFGVTTEVVVEEDLPHAQGAVEGFSLPEHLRGQYAASRAELLSAVVVPPPAGQGVRLHGGGPQEAQKGARRHHQGLQRQQRPDHRRCSWRRAPGR